jgi:5-methyltetrahydropteroyltriglutamate--homocysteine methyltransferase
MLTSRERILTTHVGSLPRVGGLADLLVGRAEGGAVDPAELDSAVARATAEVVARQRAAGIDIANNGEMPRPSFASYIAERMSGFGQGAPSRRPLPLDAKTFPVWFDFTSRSGRRRMNVYAWPQAVGPLSYDDLSGVAAECETFQAALDAAGGGFAETFMTAVSPGFAATSLANNWYDSQEAYTFALAGELAKEYRYIVGRGHVLQIDAPDMGMERAGFYQDRTLSQFLEAMDMHVAALNRALAGIPRERVRLHVCWGNRDGPHVYDVPCPDVLPAMYQAEVGALSLPFANPRHAHEIEALRTQPLPDHMVLVPGVIETTNNYVEHPLLVAERIERAVACVGDRARVIASTDCGFGTIAGDSFTTEDVAWAKLAALAEGARIASARLWG